MVGWWLCGGGGVGWWGGALCGGGVGGEEGLGDGKGCWMGWDEYVDLLRGRVFQARGVVAIVIDAYVSCDCFR